MRALVGPVERFRYPFAPDTVSFNASPRVARTLYVRVAKRQEVLAPVVTDPAPWAV